MVQFVKNNTIIVYVNRFNMKIATTTWGWIILKVLVMLMRIVNTAQRNLMEHQDHSVMKSLIKSTLDLIVIIYLSED